jgi:ABC-type multidrug transport system fused ATPase/permease subunit
MFDEPTSSLDQNTETKIMRTIKDWINSSQEKRKTAIFIAHRLSTISDCDLIYVMNEGRVVEFGTHEQLLDLNGLYASMWRLQSK